jgi:hypothetical protein
MLQGEKPAAREAALGFRRRLAQNSYDLGKSRNASCSIRGIFTEKPHYRIGLFT